jgi:hypothetical protein
METNYFLVNAVYHSIWIKRDQQKIKVSNNPPHVRASQNPLGPPSPYPVGLYTSARVGDMDYFGWICIEIWSQLTIVPNHISYVLDLEPLPNGRLYKRLLSNHKQRIKRGKRHHV